MDTNRLHSNGGLGIIARASPPMMAQPIRCSAAPFLLFLLLLCHLVLLPSVALGGSCDGGAGSDGEEFTEELLLKPLPDRKLLAHFHFQSTAPPSDANGRHHLRFPKAIAQLVKKFHIKDLELSFTQGRWSYDNWGGSDPLASRNAKPPGVELWATFNHSNNEIDFIWKNLTHTLSGLFCASVNFLQSTTAFSAPTWGFRSNSSNLRYGALPREAVCTENLTPWLKLLPCRDKAGLASLLNRTSIYKVHYHSLRLRLISSKFTGIVLEQTLTVVLQPGAQRNKLFSSSGAPLQPNWSISSVFGAKVTEPCDLAKASRIFLELEKGLVAELNKLDSEDSWNSSVFELSLTPDRVIREVNTVKDQIGSILYEYKHVNFNDDEPFDLGVTWKHPLVWAGSHAVFHSRRFLMGSGNERGSIAISWQSSGSDERFFDNSDGCLVHAVIFQVVPWYVKVYYHTLQIFMDGEPQTVSNVVKKIQVSPSEDKLSPGTLEMILEFPCSMKSAALTLDFDKGFLHIDEYPPDANQGFDIPSALISFADFHSSRIYGLDNSSDQSPLLCKFKEGDPVQSYTEVLLVPLTTPDFSMPYNVITFTCTVLALYFGSLLNVLRRRIGEEERLLKNKERPGLIPRLLSKLSTKLKGQTPGSTKTSSPPSSSSLFGPKLLLKVISIVVLAVVWHWYVNGN